MHACWLAWKGDAEVPVATAIDPLQMPHAALPFIVLYDVDHEVRRFRVRLVGTAVVEETGQDRTGEYGDEVAMREQYARFWQCIETRIPYVVTSNVTWTSRDHKRYTALGLPFVDHENRVTRLMFVFSFSRAG